jgi:hypothetical protein
MLLTGRVVSRLLVALGGGGCWLMIRVHAILALGARSLLEEAAWLIVDAVATVTSFALAHEMHPANLFLPITGSRAVTFTAFPISIWRL